MLQNETNPSSVASSIWKQQSDKEEEVMKNLTNPYPAYLFVTLNDIQKASYFKL